MTSEESLEKPTVLDRIPTKYRDLPDSDLLEEMWQPAIKADQAEREQQTTERKEAIEAFKKRAELAEASKEQQVSELYSAMPEEQRTRFPEYQKLAGDFITDAIKLGTDFIEKHSKGLQPEERYVLSLLQVEYATAKENGKPFVVKLEKPILQRTLMNLIQRLSIAYSKRTESVASTVTPGTERKVEQIDQKEKKKVSMDAQNMESISQFAENTELEGKEELVSSLDKAIEVLKRHEGIATLEREDVPTVVISDLHARRDFLVNVLKHELDRESVHDKLKRGEVNVVCVGDGMHSENGKNWIPEQIKYDLNKFLSETTDKNMFDRITAYKLAFEKALGKKYEDMSYVDIKIASGKQEALQVFSGLESDLKAELMKREMVRSLGLMKMVMDLKSEYPDSFHYTRGNHDDMAEKIKKYMKFANESKDVKDWIIANYGDDFLQKYAEFEEALPVMVRSKTGEVVVTHTVPDKPLTKDAIEKRSRETNISLTWTDNTKGGSSQQAVDETLKNVDAEDGTWFIGHRDVPDDMGLAREQFGKVVQINNKDKQVVAIKRPGQKFQKDRDTVDVAS